jgi:hypothetical protein
VNRKLVRKSFGRGPKGRTDAKEYANSPERTLVVSPDNLSRTEINERIHAELQGWSVVGSEEHHIRTLAPRQDLTGADRTWAERTKPAMCCVIRARRRRPASARASTHT